MAEKQRPQRVTWTSKTDRKVLLYAMNPSPKDIDFAYIATKIPNATPKAIMERMAKMMRERKAMDSGSGYTAENNFKTVGENAKKSTPAKPRTPKAGSSSKASGKRKRIEEEDGDASDDGIDVAESIEEKPVVKKIAKKVAPKSDHKDDESKELKFPMPTSAQAKASAKKIKLAAEKAKKDAKKDEEDAGAWIPLVGGKPNVGAKKEAIDDKNLLHAVAETGMQSGGEDENGEFEVVG